MLTIYAAIDEGSSPPAEGCGYGWFPGTLAGRRALYHPGDNAGFGALNVWLPDDDRHLIVLTNEERIDLEALFGELIARTFPK